MKNDMHIRLNDENLNNIIEIFNNSNKSKNYIINRLIGLGIKYDNFVEELKLINNNLYKENQKLVYIEALLKQLFANIDIRNVDIKYSQTLKEFNEKFYNRKLNE